MSVDYNFQINIARQGYANITSLDIVKCYLEAGWSLYSEKNKIIYTTAGDDDDFDFLADAISEIEYFDIVKQKEKNKETVAFALFYDKNYFKWKAEKDGKTFTASDPLRLLGIVTIVQEYGDAWDRIEVPGYFSIKLGN